MIGSGSRTPKNWKERELVPAAGCSSPRQQSAYGGLWQTAVTGAAIVLALQCLRGDVYTFTAQDGLNAAQVADIAESPDGNIWVGSTGGAYEFDGRWIHHSETNGPGGRVVLAIEADRAGTVWVGSENGIYRWATNRWDHFEEARMGRGKLFWGTGLGCTPNGGVWLTGADHRIHRYQDGSWKSYGTEAGLPDDFGTSLTCDARGQVWVTFEMGDVARFDGEAWRVWKVEERPWKQGKWGDTVYATSVAVDHRNNVWVGTWDGLYVFDGERWQDKSPRALTAGEGLCVVCVTADRYGRVWYSSFSQGVFSFDRESWHRLNRANYSLPGDFMQTLFPDSRNYLWIAERDAGLHRLALGARATPLRLQDLQLVAHQVARTAEGDMWVATGYSWVSTYLHHGADLRRYRPDSSVEIYGKGASNLLTKEIRGLELGPDGTLWLATACGLLRWEENRFRPCSLTVGDELRFSGVAYRADPADVGQKEAWFRSSGRSEEWSHLESPVWPTADYGLRKPDAIGWYCLRFEMPRAYTGWELLFVGGQAHDQDEVYCNGEQIGGSSIYTRGNMADIVYVVPSSAVRAGVENSLHIRLQGTLQPATILQQPRLMPIRRLTEAMDLTSLAVDQLGRVWVSTSTGQLARYEEGSWTEPPLFLPELSTNSFRPPCLHVDRQGFLWIGSEGALKVLPPGAKAAVQPEDHPGITPAFPHLEGVRCIGEDRTGILWFATDVGLGKWSRSTWQFAPWPFPAHWRSSVCLAFGAQNRVWAGTCCKDLVVYDGRRWSIADVFRRAGPGIRDLAVDGEKGIWAASDVGGLSYWPFDSAPPHVKLTSPATQVSSAGKVAFSWEAWDQWQQTPRAELSFDWQLDDGPWTWAGLSNPNLVFLDSLKPGRHKFGVRAVDRDLNYSEPDVILFSVAWPVWRQGWFLGLVGGLATLLGISAVFAWNRHRRLQAAWVELGMSATKLEEANVRLKELDQLKTQFLSNVSHELRTPLTSIKGAADNLLDGIVGELSPAQREYAQLVRASTQRLMPFVDELLDVARIENGRLTLVLGSVEVGHVLQGTVKALQPLALEQQVTLRCEAQDGKMRVRADVDRLSQVLLNLGDNALKFTPPGGTVTVKADVASPGFIRFSVTDTGPGVPEAEQQHIFDKFYQIPGQAQTGRRGAGLGLSIAKGIVEAHGGVMGIESRPGAGSTFWFTVPQAGKSEMENSEPGF